MKPITKFVTLYEREQLYGGTHEGGWSYDHYSPISTPVKIKVKPHGWSFKPIKRYKKVFDELNSEVDENSNNYWDGGIELYFEDVPYEFETKRRPCYE